MEPEAKRNAAPTAQPASATELSVTGMTCGNCARHVAEAIQSVPGVRSAMIRLEDKAATVRWDKDAKQDTGAVIRAVAEAGYGAEVMADAPERRAGDRMGGWRLNLLVGAVGTVPLLLGEWVFGLAREPWFQWCSFGLAGMVQAVAGARFYRGAWGQLKSGQSNMDTLVALGSTTAFGYSTWALLSGAASHLFFMEAAAIITLISAGHWLESRMSARASSALRSLLDLAPALARRCGPDGAEADIPVAELQVGDRVVLRPGDRVATDGEVAEGASAVDESMLTGESTPVEKDTGSPLYAGTVVANGRLVMRVTATGEETALAHIIAAVQRAQNSRANIQRLGDRVSSVFVPLVVAIALAAGLGWGLAPASMKGIHEALARVLWSAHLPDGPLAAAFIIAAGVLIIACPCAMGLATPAAIMAGSNAAARRGILIRDGVALEKAGAVSAVLFDKTGTLTIGRPTVVEIWEHPAPRSGAPSANYPVRGLVAALARHSSHPVSQALANLSADGPALSDWQEIRGSGVQAAIPAEGDGTVARLGSTQWLAASGTDLEAGHEFITSRASQGATVVGLAAGSSLRALFAIQDAIKPGAAEVVRRIEQQGLEVFLVTGDNPVTAASIAQQTGIRPERVFAQIRPEQKAEMVRRLQLQGKRVAFVGDGINDAPALEQADLGIAVSRASDVAREAADIILLKSEIEAVPESLGLARATLRTIHQNLFWAFFYNAVGIPLAAFGFLSPILCAAAMGFSDVIVIGNALRLRRWRAD